MEIEPLGVHGGAAQQGGLITTPLEVGLNTKYGAKKGKMKENMEQILDVEYMEADNKEKFVGYLNCMIRSENVGREFIGGKQYGESSKKMKGQGKCNAGKVNDHDEPTPKNIDRCITKSTSLKETE